MTVRRHFRWMSVCLAAGVSGTGFAEDLTRLYELREGRTRRVSSADEPGMNPNSDSRAIPEGETHTVADIEGPGIIRHIWFTFYGHDPKQGRSLVLRIYWDGREAPAVESPVGDFFAVGHGAWKRVDSRPVSITSEARSYNCWWPMPFAQRCRITVTNESKQHRAGIFYYVDYEQVPSLPAETPYFHAQYRQEYPAEAGRDYLVADLEGRGHYVGTVLSVQFRTTGWFGEGDDKIYIDGAPANVPAAPPATQPRAAGRNAQTAILRGTGTEDYFCDAWGFRAFNRPYYGVTLWEGIDVGDRVTAYRWHIADPIRFNKSLRFTIEHKGVMEDQEGKWYTNFAERRDLYSSVAFWYQTGIARRFTTLPPVEQRTPPHVHIELDGLADDIRVKPADMDRTIQRGTYSGGRHLLILAKEAGAEVTMPFNLDRPIKGVARLRLAKCYRHGAWEVKLDGRVPRMHAVDLYSPDDVDFTELLLGRIDLAAGQHELTFTCIGKNLAAQEYGLSVDALTIEEIEHYREVRSEK